MVCKFLENADLNILLYFAKINASGMIVIVLLHDTYY